MPVLMTGLFKKVLKAAWWMVGSSCSILYNTCKDLWRELYEVVEPVYFVACYVVMRFPYILCG